MLAQQNMLSSVQEVLNKNVLKSRFNHLPSWNVKRLDLDADDQVSVC
ncbi:hypothetical protein [Thalassotalea montiporae]